jgi:hypothetical protein
MADPEKNEVVHQLERRVSQESNLSDQAHIDAFTPEEQKKIIWRIDRTNLGIAAVGGMAVGKSR